MRYADAQAASLAGPLSGVWLSRERREMQVAALLAARQGIVPDS
jgi:hypothetical protein